jgi:hypothetical protein
VLAAPALAIGRAEEEQIASGTGISRAVVAATGMHSGEVREGTTDRAPERAAIAAPPAWDLEVEAGAAVVVVVVGGADRSLRLRNSDLRSAA